MQKLSIPKEERINLYKLTIARNDVTEAYLTTNLFLKTIKGVQDELFQPLQDAIVIAYARPFTSNKPFGPLEEKWTKFMNSEFQATHDRLILTRNKLIAHSDKDFREVVVMPKGTSIDVPGMMPNDDVVLRVSNTKIAMQTFPIIQAISYELGARLDDAIGRVLNKFFDNCEMPTKPFDILDFKSKY